MLDVVYMALGFLKILKNLTFSILQAQNLSRSEVK